MIQPTARLATCPSAISRSRSRTAHRSHLAQ